MNEYVIHILYVVSSALFVLSLLWMKSPTSARRGVFAGELGMLLAVVGTLLSHHVVTYDLIAIAFLIGAVAGVPLAYLMPMTAVPQRTAISHAFGALAAALIGTAEFYAKQPTGFVMVALVLEMLLGYLTFTGSLMAFGKLQEILPTRPILYKGQNFVNLSVFVLAVALGVAMIVDPTQQWLLPVFAGLSLLFGVMLIGHIGGAYMPTEISLFNS